MRLAGWLTSGGVTCRVTSSPHAERCQWHDDQSRLGSARLGPQTGRLHPPDRRRGQRRGRPDPAHAADRSTAQRGPQRSPGDPRLPSNRLAVPIGEQPERSDRAGGHLHESAQRETFDVHTQLSALPFHCIITCSHDASIERALEAAGKPPRVAAYHFKGTTEQLNDAGTQKQPLVYHLFGTPAEPRSLVLTEQDLVDFLVAVVARTPPIPDVLLSELRNPDRMFLFLGFGVRNWYPRVLLHVLKMQSGNSRSFALEEFPPPADLDRGVFFYRHGYKVEVFNRDAVSFAAELTERFQATGAPGARMPTRPAAPGPRPSVFICHVHDNAALAERIAVGLNGRDLDAWLDRINLEPGANWDDTIERRIAEVDYFVILITPELAARERSYAFRELTLARQQAQMFRSSRRFIIPIQVGGAPMLEELADLHQGPIRGAGGDEPLTLTPETETQVIDRLASSIRRDQQLRLKKGA